MNFTENSSYKTKNNKQKIFFYLLATIVVVGINFNSVIFGIKPLYYATDFAYEMFKIVMIYFLYKIFIKKDIRNTNAYILTAYIIFIHSVSLIGLEYYIGFYNRDLITPIIYSLIFFRLYYKKSETKLPIETRR